MKLWNENKSTVYIQCTSFLSKTSPVAKKLFHGKGRQTDDFIDSKIGDPPCC